MSLELLGKFGVFADLLKVSANMTEGEEVIVYNLHDTKITVTKYPLNFSAVQNTGNTLTIFRGIEGTMTISSIGTDDQLPEHIRVIHENDIEILEPNQDYKLSTLNLKGISPVIMKIVTS